jgi:thiamine kinase-like enzyme
MCAGINPAAWDLAELFDVVIMSSPDFISEDYSTNIKPYPNHSKYFEAVRVFWNENPDIDSWLLKSYEYLKSQN